MYPDAPWTWPVDGDDRLASVRGRYLRLLARRLLVAVPATVQAALAPLVRGPDLYAALTLPQVGGALLGGDAGTAAVTLLLELARRRVLPAEGVWWSAPVGRLVSPTLGRELTLPTPAPRVRFGPGWVELSRSDTWELDMRRGDVVFHPLAEGGWFALADTNPLAMEEAHPEKEGNALSLGGATVDTWLGALDDARERVRLGSAALADEHQRLLATVVPVGSHAERSTSASYQEAIGLLYVSLHPNPVTMAEALVHETQHTKLNLLSWVDPLFENGDERHPSPVRPDPRPLWGVVLAVHAFLPVARLHRAWLDAGVPWADERRFDAVRRLNHDGMEVLRAHARPTAMGRELLDGLDALERSFG